MRKKYLKVISVSLLLSCITFGSVACGGNEYKITFVSEGNSDIVRYVKKGKTLADVPATPEVKGKYCVWDSDDFQNIQSDRTITALCYSKVTNLYTNMPTEIDVEVFSDEADLDYIFKDLEIEATFESGEKKKVYEGEYTLLAENYNKDVSGEYTVSIVYNDAKQDIKINVNKIDNYATVSLYSGTGYYNEGLPSLVANTDVEGVATFDQGQDLYIGNKTYAWTFTPTDTNKYATLHGYINVNLVNANSIAANKDAITVDFGSSKAEIIERIKDGLKVTGKYGNDYKDINSSFYTIDSETFSVNKSGAFEFKISYDSNIYTTVIVNVKKCDTYTLNVENMNEYIIKTNATLANVVNSLVVNSNIEGSVSFKEGQTLIAGDYEYEYIFTPSDAHYATKSGKVRIHAYKANELSFTTTTMFEYGSGVNNIENELRNSMTGTITYNDSLTKNIDINKVSISISDYDSLQPGTYQYTISYDGEIEKVSTFVLDKINLEMYQDYIYVCNVGSIDELESMPYCYIQRVDGSQYDFDANLFKIIPVVGSEPESAGGSFYDYLAELVPDESISNKFNTIRIKVRAMVA